MVPASPNPQYFIMIFSAILSLTKRTKEVNEKAGFCVAVETKSSTCYKLKLLSHPIMGILLISEKAISAFRK